MARIVGGSLIGELRGKLGGTVYSRNRTGQYVRAYAVPVNPNTLAQDRARNVFGNAAASYHSLSQVQKALWHDYATGVYNPKVGVNTGQFSGFNAFTALRAVADGGAMWPHSTTIQIDGSDPVGGVTFNPYAFSTAPPTFQLEPLVKDQAGTESYPLNLGNTEVFDDGTFDITMGLTGAPTGGIDANDLEDPNGYKMGFAVYISNSNPQPGMFYQNEMKYLLGYVENPVFSSPDADAISSITIKSTAFYTLGRYQQFPILGKYVKCSVYATSMTGMLAMIAQKEIQITAS